MSLCVIQMSKPIDRPPHGSALTIKTRLSPYLSRVQRLRLHRWMFKKTWSVVSQLSNQEVVPYVFLAARQDYDDVHASLDRFVKACDNSRKSEDSSHKSQQKPRLQDGVNLGARIKNACLTVISECNPSHIIIVGADCPSLTAADFDRASRALKEGSDAYVIPALDGGYVMLAFSQACFEMHASELLDDIPWGTERVFDITIARMKNNKISVTCGKPLSDIDEFCDLKGLPTSTYLESS